ncbi:MAG TPA: isoaspartyl peptidase/L-asparaginase, partial [Egibacteraceae bacterium]|nr:isoaspartyl peptidase/L-asparaginase [Egibacteraceae bacterium]
MGSARLIVHGGLGTPDSPVVRQALEQALDAGWRELSQTGDPVAGACAAVRVLEDDGRFNAGSGGVPADTGEVELDAGVFQGWTGRFAGVAALRDVANPVLVAAALLAHRPGAVLLAGEGA